MIKRDPIIEKILVSCKDLEPLYEKWIWYSVQETEVRDIFGEVEEVIYSEPSLCSQLVSLCSAVNHLMKKNEYEEARKVFSAVEHVLEEASSELKGDFEVCFFESIMNVLSNQEEDYDEIIDKDRLYSLLGPISRELCRRNDEFWGTKIF